MKTDLSSKSRARAFLWLCFHYLENPATNSKDNYDNDVIVNPFGDPRKDGKPTFVHLKPEEAVLENVDPPDEIKLAEKLVVHRANLLQSKQSKDKLTLPSSASGSVIGDAHDTPDSVGEEFGAGPQAKGKKKRENAPTVKNPRTTTNELESTPAADKMPKGRRQKAGRAGVIVEGTAASGRECPSIPAMITCLFNLIGLLTRW
jgi:Ino eighty subunit 1